MKCFVFILTLVLALGSFALRAQDDVVTDEQILTEMKTYLMHLNGEQASESHLNQQLEFLKKITPIWKIPEFRKLRAMPFTDLIQLPSKEQYSYYFLAITFHEENIEEHYSSISDPEFIKKVIQFRDQLRAMGHFVLMGEIKDLPKDLPVIEMKFTPQNSYLSFVTPEAMFLWNTQTLESKLRRVFEYAPMGIGMEGPRRLGLTTVAFSQDERLIAIGTKIGFVKIIDRNNPSFHCILPESDEREKSDEIYSLAFSPNVDFLAVGTWDFSPNDHTPIVHIYRLDPNLNFKLFMKREEGYEIHGLAFTLDNRYLIGHHHFGDPIWQIPEGSFLRESADRDRLCDRRDFNLDGKLWRTVCVGNERIARNSFIYDKGHMLQFHDENAFDFDPKTNLIAYSNDNHILYAKRSKLSPRTQIFQTECEINDVVISPDASMIGVVSHCPMETSFQDHVHLFKKQTEPDWNLLLLINPDTLIPSSEGAK